MSNNDDSGVKLDVRAYPVREPKGTTVGFASVTVADIIAVHGIRVINGENCLFASMPQQKDAEGIYRDICHPISSDLRKRLNSAVIGAYKEAVEKGAEDRASVSNKIKESKATPKDTSKTERGKPGKEPASQSKQSNDKTGDDR